MLARVGVVGVVLGASLVVLLYLGKVLVEVGKLLDYPPTSSISATTVVERGRYDYAGIQPIVSAAPSSSAAAVVFLQPKLAEDTTSIKAELGAAFGLKFVVSGEPMESIAELEVRLTHPPLLDSLEVKTQSLWSERVKTGEPAFVAWLFEYEYERVPGDWRFEVLFKDQVIAQESFTVYR